MFLEDWMRMGMLGGMGLVGGLGMSPRRILLAMILLMGSGSLRAMGVG
jgi:hypothetical protein